MMVQVLLKQFHKYIKLFIFYWTVKQVRTLKYIMTTWFGQEDNMD